MKHETINYTLVGAFVFTMGIVLVFSLYAITGRVASSDQYNTVLTQAGGISKGSDVTFNGYKIGEVFSIEPVFGAANTQFKIELALKQGWQVREDSVASINKPGLLSDSQINIVEGSSNVFLKPGSAIRGGENTDIMEVMSKLGEQINGLSVEVIKPLLEQIQSDLNLFGKNVNSQLPELTGNLNTLVVKLQKNADIFDSLLSQSNVNNIKTLLSESSELTKNLNRISSSVDGLVSENTPELQRSMDQINQSIGLLNSKIESISYHLEEGSRNVNEFSRQLKENPGVIIRSKPAADEVVK